MRELLAICATDEHRHAAAAERLAAHYDNRKATPRTASAQLESFYPWFARAVEEAGALCDKIVKRQPRNANALHLLGVVHLHRGNDADAVSMLTRAAN